ncbi:MAG TPA: thiol reductant ABC exporter subunit CydC [Candidatus Faecimorpha stercoravium]|nr:thiol reductant ABC exporter subunit CydC [Candidatus Faecimorpha stercoravium]
MKHRSSAKIMGSLIGLVKPLAPFMILAILMGVAGFLTAILITVFGGFALLEVLGNPAGIALGTVFACVLLFAVARGFLRYAEQACNHYIAFKLLALIRDRVFGALRKLAPAKLEGRDRGNLISIITSDIELLEVFYAHTISPCCIAVIVSLLMLIFIGSFHGALALVALVGYAVVGVLVPFVISRRTRRSGDAFRAEFGDMNAYFMDSLRGLREILQYDMGQERGEQIGIRTQKMSESEEEVKRQGGLSSAVTGFLILFFTLVMLLMAGVLYQQGSIGFEGVLIPVITMASSFGPVLAVANLGSGLAQTLAAGDRVLDILEEEPQVQEVETGKDAIFTGARVEDVSFAYDQDTILQHMNMEIRKGQITGISGPSGSGKSTLLKLLMRFWDTEQGVIRISETPIQEIRTKSLRKMESYVTQETQLFHDSIENNLRVAKWDATREEIEEACKKAAVHDFILSLPKGYETMVGELGSTLSGGERQRLGVSRAFLHNAPLILLDEPTSNLDSLNESVILKSLKEEKEKTVVLVSHRPSTMRIADTVYSVENGRLS